MSEIKNVGWMAKCNQLTPLPFQGLTECTLDYQHLTSSNDTILLQSPHTKKSTELRATLFAGQFSGSINTGM